MIKQSIAAISLVTLISSCGSDIQSSDALPAAINMTPAETHKYTKGSKIDPICEMEWDTAWVDFTVYQGDTIRFCSQNCKMAFEARREKYIK